MNSDRPDRPEKERRRKMGQGNQYDVMKRVRKEMPPSTKVIQPKVRRPSNNWRDFLDEDDNDDNDGNDGLEGGVE